MSSDGDHFDGSASDDRRGGLPRVLSVLDMLTEEELVQLNHVIVQRIRLMQQIRAHGQMVNLHIGQSVAFTTAAGARIVGVIARHNRKSVTVVTPTGEQWRVSPSLVEPQSTESDHRPRP